MELVNIQYHVPLRVSRALSKEVVRNYYETEAARALKSATAALKRAGATTTARYVVGNVVHKLAAIVANDPADLIVMGSHGATGLKLLLLGSVASTVAVSSTKPLLIVREGAVPRKDSLKLGIALDGSPYGLAAARFVARHRKLFGPAPAISLIHMAPELTKIVVPGWLERAVETGIKPEQIEAMHKAAFESVFAPVREVLDGAGLASKEVRLIGRVPGDEIAAHATKSRLDLLVMGSLGFGASRHTAMGSVAARVASRCRTALLLVREK